MDWKSLLMDGKSQPNKTSTTMPTSNYAEQDYFEIITSAAFRRLQDKTQVYTNSKSDFIRTRLTHSLEVSTIAGILGKSIWRELYNRSQENQLENTYGYEFKQINKIEKILQCSGLLHDIGNPPLGHCGEDVIRKWFKNNIPVFEANGIVLNEQMKADFINFEGNAQALRVISRLHPNRLRKKLFVSLATMSSIIKYPIPSTEINCPPHNYKKMGYFLDNEDLFEDIVTELNITRGVRNPLAYILEAADDIAYRIADMEDAVKRKYVTEEEFKAVFNEKIPNVTPFGEKADTPAEILEKPNEDGFYSAKTSIMTLLRSLRNVAIRQASNNFVEFYDDIMTGEFEGDLLNPGDLAKEDEDYPAIAKIFDEFESLAINNVYEKIENSIEMRIYEGTIEKYLDMFVPIAIYYDSIINDTKPDNMDDKEFKELKKFKDLYWDKLPGHSVAECEKSVASIRENDEYTEEEKSSWIYYKRILVVTDFISGMTDRYAFENFAESDKE